jgi:hypothetical protein
MTSSVLIAGTAEDLQPLKPREAVKLEEAAAVDDDLQDSMHEPSCAKQLLHKPQVTCTGGHSAPAEQQQGPESSRSPLVGSPGSSIHASVRRLLQGPAEASSSQQVQLDAVLNPSGLLSLDGLGVGFLGMGQALGVGLEQQAVASSSTSSSGSGGSSSASDPLLLRVMLVQRVGLCGNGVCEVGERALLNAAGGVLQEADAPCPQVGGVMARQRGQQHLCSTRLGLLPKTHSCWKVAHISAGQMLTSSFCIEKPCVLGQVSC